MEQNDPIIMFEISATMFVGPVFVDDKGNQIVCLKMYGKDSMHIVKNLKLWW